MNWGNKLLLTFIVFALGISYLVYRSMNVNYELVSKEYYKDELRYQDVIDAVKRANALSSGVQMNQDNANIVVQLPKEMLNEKVKGEIWFYCASNEKKDRHISLELNNSAQQQISKKILMPGSYSVRFDWEAHNLHYHSEEPLTIL